MRARVSLAALLCCACCFDAPFKHRLPTEPARLGDGWEIAAPRDVGLDDSTLAALHEQLLREDRDQGATAVLIAKNGKLVWETYLHTTADRDRVHHVQSITKSITSVVFGIARDQGLFGTLDERLDALFPEEMAGFPGPKQEIRLRDVLTMRSGLDFENQQFSMEMWVGNPPDPLRHILGKPLYASPGERFRYRDVDPQLIGFALQRRAGVTEEELARQTLFEPLGITEWYWGAGSTGVSMGAHGLHLKPRDLLRIGQLVLDGGEHGGVQRVSRAWLLESTAAQVDTPYFDGDGNVRPYGYYWWLVPGIGYAASGHGGQYVLVVPRLSMVIVQLGMPDAAVEGDELNAFVELVRPLVGP